MADITTLMGHEVRRTSADIVYEALHDRISSLVLMPNDKISEAEVASEFNVSRQPVRDAFARLAGSGFVNIRPQRATRVCAFSHRSIADARFVRMAVELEVISRLARNPDLLPAQDMQANLASQTKAVDQEDFDAFHDLDDAFHRILCYASGHPGAHDTVLKMKAQVDRLCRLSLSNTGETTHLVEDHHAVVDRVMKGDEPGARKAVQVHLSRLDRTINEVVERHPSFFVD